MAITDINISEQLETDAPSIKYTGNEGPQASPQHQQEQMIAQQIWEALSPEQQGQFQSFEQFFRSGVWKQILQQMQQDEAQGPEQQGIGSLGPEPMQPQMPMPNRMGAQYGGRMGFQQGSRAGDESALMKKVQFLMSELGLSQEEAFERVLPKFRKPRDPRRPIDPGFTRLPRDPRGPIAPGFIRPPRDPRGPIDPGFIRPRRMGYAGGEMVEGFAEGIEKVGRGSVDIVEKIKETVAPFMDEATWIQKLIEYLRRKRGEGGPNQGSPSIMDRARTDTEVEDAYGVSVDEGIESLRGRT